MTQEEKAKAYDEALKRAREFQKSKDGLCVLTAESIFPELRESENERMRKAALEGIEYLERKLGWDAIGDIDILDVKEYLEKQKEQKEELVYRLNGLMQEYIKDGKDENEKEYRLKCYQLFWDALEDTNFFEQKEQKSNNPDEIINLKFSVGDVVCRKGWADHTIKELFLGKEPVYICTNDEGLESHIPYSEQDEWELKQKGQKPEWSEEDEKFIKELCNLLASIAKNNYVGRYYAPDLVNKLLSLRPQPKQEWSEEDELNTCPHYSDGYGCDISPMKKCEYCEHRPSWKPI